VMTCPFERQSCQNSVFPRAEAQQADAKAIEDLAKNDEIPTGQLRRVRGNTAVSKGKVYRFQPLASTGLRPAPKQSRCGFPQIRIIQLET
jgi:hypothetical protein